MIQNIFNFKITYIVILHIHSEMASIFLSTKIFIYRFQRKFLTMYSIVSIYI